MGLLGELAGSRGHQRLSGDVQDAGGQLPQCPADRMTVLVDHHHPPGLVQRDHADGTGVHDDVTLGHYAVRHPHDVPAEPDDPPGEDDVGLRHLVVVSGAGTVARCHGRLVCGHPVRRCVRLCPVRLLRAGLPHLAGRHVVGGHDGTSSSQFTSADNPWPSTSPIPLGSSTGSTPVRCSACVTAAAANARNSG